jgi:hypothetical protein
MDREESVIGRCEDEFLLPERAAARRAEDEKLLATGEPLADCVECFEAEDGSELWFSENRTALRDESGATVARGKKHAPWFSPASSEAHPAFSALCDGR